MSEFHEFDSEQRRVRRRERLLWAEWEPTIRGVNEVILLLRHRGGVADRRALWVLAALTLSVVLGLFYHIGLPIWQNLKAAVVDIYQEQFDAAKQANADNDRRLQQFREQWLSGINNFFFGIGIANDGKTAIAASGTIEELQTADAVAGYINTCAGYSTIPAVITVCGDVLKRQGEGPHRFR